jgi:hypothetical protein
VYILHSGLSEQEAFEYECWYINEYRFVYGFNLCNLTDGGEGISGFKHSEKTIKQNRMQLHGFDIEDFKDEIIDMYINKTMTTSEIATNFKVTDVCIARVLKKFNIQLRKSGATKYKNKGEKRYNSKYILVRNVNNEIVNCFDSISLCGEWLASIGLVNHANGGKKAIRSNVDTSNNYKGLFFQSINRSEYFKILEHKANFVPFKVNKLNIESIASSNIVEVYDNKGILTYTFSSLAKCANWLEIITGKSFSACRDAIYRSSRNGKLYKKAYKFIIYKKSDYNKKIAC